MSPTSTRPLSIRRLRACPYDRAETLQRDAVERLRHDPTAPEELILVEHRPVITIGRSGGEEHLLRDKTALAAQQIELRHVGRGGDITYHGPGQWTVYPVLRLDTMEKDLHKYMRKLETAIIHYIGIHGIAGHRIRGKTGVWVDRNKIAAIGIAVTRWITWHGFAVNIQPELRPFRDYMVPCGIAATEGGVTSLAEVTGQTFAMETEGDRLLDAFCRVFPFHPQKVWPD